MQTVLALQAGAGAIYLLTIAAVGLRLLHLSYRTRELPELLLAGALLLGGVLGGPLEGAGVSTAAELGPALAGSMILYGKALCVVSVSCHACFVLRVFRPHSQWAKVFVAAVIGLLVASFAGYWMSGTFVTGQISLTWFWVNLTAQLGTSFWLVVEGYRYYRQLKRRLVLGLTDPVICNRFLLWSLAGVFSLVLLLSSVPPTFLDPTRHAHLLTADLFVFSVCGVLVSALYFLTFFPPEAYRLWLKGSAPETA